MPILSRFTKLVYPMQAGAKGKRVDIIYAVKDVLQKMDNTQ
jgi:hypothetical protein